MEVEQILEEALRVKTAMDDVVRDIYQPRQQIEVIYMPETDAVLVRTNE